MMLPAMNSNSASASFDPVSVSIEQYLTWLYEFLEKTPQAIKHKETLALQQECYRLLTHTPKKIAQHKSFKGLWEQLRTMLKRFYQALSQSLDASSLLSYYEDLSRSYERLIATMRTQAKSLGQRVPKHLNSLKPLISWRSLFHASMGIFAALMYQFVLTQRQCMYVLLSILSVFFTLEALRRLFPGMNTFLLQSPIFRPIARPHEFHQINSSTYYVIALSIITALFSRVNVIASILVLACADPAAAWIGKKYGRVKLYRQKSVLGSLTFLVVAMIVCLLAVFYVGTPLPLGRALIGVLSMSVWATVTELFSSRVDDNLTIPLAASLGGYLLGL